MKIRVGFVSNSSSSSFVVELPKDFEEFTSENLNDEVKEALTDHYSEEIEDEVEMLSEGIRDMNRCISLLKSGKTIYEVEEGCYNALVVALDDYTVAVVDSAGGDGAGTISHTIRKKSKRGKSK